MSTEVAAGPVTESAPVATSVADQAVAAGDVSAYRAARAAERTGKPLTPPAESSPAQPAEQAASTEVKTDKPASETGEPPKNAETRLKELLAERAKERERAERAERELAELRRGVTQPKETPKAESSPAPAATAITYPPDLASYDAYLEKHPDASYEEYSDARGDFRYEQREQQREAAKQAESQRTQQSEAARERDTKFRERVEAAGGKDFIAGLSEDVRTLKPFEALEQDKATGRWRDPATGQYVPAARAALAEELLTSEVAPQLMRHFTDHPEELARITTLHPKDFLKELGKIEASLSAAKPAPVTPPKTVSDAPAPPTVLGTRPGAPADPVMAAATSGDVAGYRAARLSQRIATLR